MLLPLPVLRPAKDDRGSARIPERTWAWLAVIGAALGFVFGGDLGRWVGAALLLAVAPILIEPLRHQPIWTRARTFVGRWAPLGIVVVLAAILLGDLALGRPPISRDHGVHYYQTKILVDELIPRGELIGWSERLNTGYPFGDSYPVLGYVMTGAAHLLSFRLIELRTSYAWGLLGVWIVGIVAVWWLASMIARELRGEAVEQAPKSKEDQGDEDEAEPAAVEEPSLAALMDPRWAGALAALAFLIDPGASREGGWNYLMFHGVWPQMLSSALWIASLPATWAALRRPSPRSLALAALLLGGSLLAHPFGMLTAATSAVAWPIVLWATGALRKLPGGQFRWWLAIHALAGLVCVGWVLTFLMSAGSMARSPVPWKALGALTAELLAGELFRDYRAWVGVLTVIGMFAALRRGRALAWLGLGLVCALLVLASEASITILRLDLLVSSFKNLQFPRYSLALKPLLHAFAGVGGALLLGRLAKIPNRDHPAASAQATRPAAGRLLAAICLAPLLVGVLDSGDRLIPHPVGGLPVFDDSPHGEVDEALLEALDAEASQLDRPLTVAFLRRRMGGGTYVLYAITDAGAKLVMDGHIPAVNYKYQVRRRGPAALRSMGVTHVIFDRALGGNADDNRLASELVEVGTFGVWTLGRLAPGELDHRFATRGELLPSDVTWTEDESLGHTIEIAQGEGELELALGPYRKWSAYDAAGEPVHFAPMMMARGVPGMYLEVGPGTVTLRYAKPTEERIAGWVSLVAIGLLLVALASGRQLHLEARLQSKRAQQVIWIVLLVGLAAIFVVSYQRQRAKLAKTWDDLIADHMHSGRIPSTRQLRLREDFVDSRAFRVTASNTDGCDGTLGKDALAGCTQDDAEPRATMVYRSPYLYRCMRVKLPPLSSVEIELPNLEPGDDLAGFFTRGERTFDDLVLTLPGSDEVFRPAGQNKRQHFHVLAEARGEGNANVIRVENEALYTRKLCFAMAGLEQD